MEYNFNEIEKKWQACWKEQRTYQVTENQEKPKYYVLDMFPYPSGAGLHVGHPLGYIASDIFARYKRLKGFNVLHPMGYDAYGLPAEQYAIQTGQHPAITTDKNINRYREQLDKIGFSFDWNREVRTCDPDYYKWTQWAFIQMFHSYYYYDAQQARPIAELIEVFEQQGTKDLNIACTEPLIFTAGEWKSKSEKEQQEILMNYRIAYLADTMVNWCADLGTVLANDEVSEGLSVRGGYPVEQRKMRQWSLRVSAYAQRLLDGLEKIDWTESLKETQRNWIGRSEGAEMRFDLSPDPSPQGRGATDTHFSWFKNTTDAKNWRMLISIAKELRFNQTEAEDTLWQVIRANKIGYKIRRQHIIDGYIADFVNLEKQVIIEIDGGIHLSKEQKEKDILRTQILNECGFDVIRFTNDEVLSDAFVVAEKIKNYLNSVPSRRHIPQNCAPTTPLPCGEGSGERSLLIFTTRPDTIFGVTFMVLAPESEYVSQVVTSKQKAEVEVYLEAVKRRTERERIADRKVTGVFSGSYAINPMNGAKIPIWISDYVLAGYGTGAIMAVPAHDSRDYAFAKHFNLPIIPLIAGADVSEESFDAKDGIMINSPIENSKLKIENGLVLNGLTVKEAIKKAKEYIAENNLGKVKVNYRLRDAIFSRQRYWGEPFPVYYKDGMPYTVDEKDLPIELPEVDKFLPTETGEPPLGRAKDWTYKAEAVRG
jgi:leucyl-tRNA synthetase